MREQLTIRILLLGILVFAGIDRGYPAAEDSSSEPTGDVRILIDVSGSMKKNDPVNLRVPALRLLINLLPRDSRAGIWLFAAEPTLLVPVGSVGDAWKRLASKSASAIHSQGLLTNIEGALNAAMDGWESGREASRRNIILLTDGMVDVGKEQALNEASRSTILERLVPKLKQLAVRVHTIALSDHADHELLKQLSQGTGGWNQYVHAARELDRAFLTMFNQAVPGNRVPLIGNKFTIDAGIEEFSVLCFRGRERPPIRLVSPGERQIGREDRNENLRWHHEANYDLVTVQKPEAGEWRLLADLDPDNQVMVVTDLNLRLEELPDHVIEYEAVEVSARITEKGETVTNSDFLSLIEIQLRLTDAAGRTREWDFEPDRAGTGLFRLKVPESLKPGKYTFRVIGNGRTFQREVEHRFEVVGGPAAPVGQATNRVDRNPGLRPKATADVPVPEPDWLMTGTIVVVVNLLVFAVGFWLYRCLRERSARQRMDLIERLAP